MKLSYFFLFFWLIVSFSTEAEEFEKKCRKSDLAPDNLWTADGTVSRFQTQVDVDQDGKLDKLRMEKSSGSGEGSRSLNLTLADGNNFRIEAESSFYVIYDLNKVPKKLLLSNYAKVLEFVELVFFGMICSEADPSLAWIVNSDKKIRWHEGAPFIPSIYTVRLPATSVAQAQSKEGQVWVSYSGHVHNGLVLPAAEQSTFPKEMDRDKNRVLLITAHGIILTDPQRTRYAWIYVRQGSDSKMRHPSIKSVKIVGNKAVITIDEWSLHDDETPEFEIDLDSGELSE